MDEFADKPTFDQEVLQRLRQDLGETDSVEDGTLTMLLVDYREDSVRLIADLHKSIAENDARLLQRSAHTLKSNSAMFGAMRLSAMAKQLEEMGKLSTLEGAAERIAQVEIEFEKVSKLL